VGACAGASLVAEAGLATLFVLASNTLLRPVVNRINRRPVDDESTESTYYVYAICHRGAQGDVREQMLELLENASYPVRGVETHAFGPQDTEIEAMLYATSVDSDELDRVIAAIEALPGVLQAFWNAGTEE